MLDRARQHIAKAVQIASEGQAFHEFPECSMLAGVDRLSIKLKDPQLHNMMQNWSADHPFTSIGFNVRDEDKNKSIVLDVELESGKGITLRNGAGKPIQYVRLSNNDPTALGKLIHPTQVTLYKILAAPSPTGLNYNVQTTDGRPYLRVEKVPVSLYQAIKAVGLFSTDCAYWIKALDGTVLGYIRPKLVKNSNTLVIKFMTNHRDAQMRAVIVGVALLLMISEVYSQLRAMLQESMRRVVGR